MYPPAMAAAAAAASVGQPHFGSGLSLNGPGAMHMMSAMSGAGGGGVGGGIGSGGGIGIGAASGYMNGSRQSINMTSDFSSLPPAVNMLSQGKDLRLDAQDILDGLEHRQ